MNYEKITVFGAGHGGYAAAGDLMNKGFDVTIFELAEHQKNLFPMMETGKIKMTGEISGVVRAPSIEMDIEKAVSSAEVILIIAHSASHQRIAKMMSPYVKDDQLIVLLPGYTGGSLCFEKVFKEQKVSAKYILAETNTLPYACRRINGESAVHIKLYVKQFLASAFPARYNDFFYEIFSRLYPNVHLTSTALEPGFNNGNPVLNVLPSIFNAGRIEYAKGEYYHYQEGVTPTIAAVMEDIDKERMKIGQALGVKVIPYLERVIHTGYVENNSSWYEMITTSPHLTAKGPDSLQHRYLTEDIPYGLTPWYAFAKKYDVDVKLIPSSIQLGSSLMGENYFEEGRTLEDMGIDRLTKEDLKEFLTIG